MKIEKGKVLKTDQAYPSVTVFFEGEGLRFPHRLTAAHQETIGLAILDALVRAVNQVAFTPSGLDAKVSQIQVIANRKRMTHKFDLEQPQPLPDEQVLTPDGDHGTSYKLRDGEDVVWIEVDNLSVRIERGPQTVWLSVFPLGKEDGRPLLEMHQREETA